MLFQFVLLSCLEASSKRWVYKSCSWFADGHISQSEARKKRKRQNEDSLPKVDGRPLFGHTVAQNVIKITIFLHLTTFLKLCSCNNLSGFFIWEYSYLFCQDKSSANFYNQPPKLTLTLCTKNMREIKL